jgi:hypothetical protein
MSSIDNAYNMYLKHIYDGEKLNLLSGLGLKVPGSVPSVMWEAFCAVLTERSGRGVTGADLLGWEVKSAVMGASFEYQYHLNTGGEKLDEDCVVNHLFCSYSATYEDVVVSAVRGPDLSERFFNAWRPGYIENYDRSQNVRRQRFRRAIPYSYPKNHGILVLEIKNSEIVNRNDAVIPQLNSEV